VRDPGLMLPWKRVRHGIGRVDTRREDDGGRHVCASREALGIEYVALHVKWNDRSALNSRAWISIGHSFLSTPLMVV
jgi:hypothetical protein